jgi:hypothetical protein
LITWVSSKLKSSVFKGKTVKRMEGKPQAGENICKYRIYKELSKSKRKITQ